MGIDYNRLSSTYDTHRCGGGPYMETLARLAREAPPGRTLELGAGTGNNTAALTQRAARPVIALEQAAGMLAKGRAKNLPARWIQGDAMQLPFTDNAFTFIYATYMLHHIADLRALFRECRRVLEKGCAAFVTVPETFIAKHPMNTYFPSFARIDLARFQPVAEVEAALRDTGFREVQSTIEVSPPRKINAEYAARIEGRFISTYDLIPEKEFMEGLRRLKADIAANGALDFPIAREAVTVRGCV
jgi:ubiquinone/menaquinone biosynthesis C-methylase UbiE